MEKIKLMADYECYPLWHHSGNKIGNINPDTLPISNSLKNELNKWAETFTKTLNSDDPLHSGFATFSEKLVFNEQGRKLQEQLQTELCNSYEVVYQPLCQFTEDKK